MQIIYTFIYYKCSSNEYTLAIDSEFEDLFKASRGFIFHGTNNTK